MIGIKGIFANRSVLFHTGVFAYLLLMGFLLSAVSGFVILKTANTSTGMENASGMSFYLLHATQFFSNIFLFFLPAAGTAYLCSHHPAGFLNMRRIPDIKVVLLSVLMLLMVFPLIDVTTYFNEKMRLPEFMAPLENWMRTTEDLAAGLTEKMLSEEGVIPFFINILIIGVMAGVTEELLFRGTLLTILREKIKNPHVAIWIIASLFSAIHFQFYGFIPRLLLGAIFGYMLYWSHSIWIPVIAHFLNNTIILIANKAGFFSDITDSSIFIPADPSPKEFILISIITTAGLIGFYFCAKVVRGANGRTGERANG